MTGAPKKRRVVVCPECRGDGYDYAHGNNPSEKPFKVECRRCKGACAIEVEE